MDQKFYKMSIVILRKIFFFFANFFKNLSNHNRHFLKFTVIFRGERGPHCRLEGGKGLRNANVCNFWFFKNLLHWIVVFLHGIILLLRWLPTGGHSVLERIWIKVSYLSQWLPQGERGPPKESKSQWIEILNVGSQ